MSIDRSFEGSVRQLASGLAPHLGLAICRHGLMLYPKGDRYVGQSLSFYGEFSEAEVDLFKQLVLSDSVVVEIGANLGAHTMALAELAGPRGHVYAFEPQFYLFNLLCANAALNGHVNLRCFQMGLGQKAGIFTLPPIDYTAVENFGGYGLSDQPGIPVEVRTLDSYIFPRLDFIKIDVEGMELEALAGAHNTIVRHQPFLYIENDREEKSEALIQTILDLNYRLWWHMPPLYNQNNFRGNKNNIFPNIVSFNMFCAPRSRTIKIDLPEITKPEHGRSYGIANYTKV